MATSMATLLTTGLTVQDYYKNDGVLEFQLDAREVGGNSTEFETFHSLKTSYILVLSLLPLSLFTTLQFWGR